MADAANIITIKNNNRYRILDNLRRAPMSRADLSRTIGLTKSAVTIITNELVSDGIIYERGLEARNNQRGRTSILLDINADYGFSVGVMLHRKHIDVSVVNIKGELVDTACEKTTEFINPDMVIDWVEDTINSLVLKNGLNHSRCVGIGIGCPGPVEYKNGVILEPPNFSLFQNYPVVEKFKAKFSVPIYLENNAVALALTEHYKNSSENVSKSKLFVVISNGIGATVLKGGKVFRGSRGFSGEIGHTSIDVNGIRCSCGNCGCLENYATMAALKRRHGFNNYCEVVDKAILGDTASCEIIYDLVKCLGSALVNTTNLYDLDEIVIYGEFSYHCDYLCKKLEHYIISHSVVCRNHGLSVKPSLLTDKDAVSASAVSAINAFYKQNLEMRL